MTLRPMARRVSPRELVAAAGFSRRPHGAALFAMAMLVETAQAGGPSHGRWRHSDAA